VSGKIADGGPAFPVVLDKDTARDEQLNPIVSDGMTLRDYFAANVIVTQAERTLFIQSGGHKSPTLFEDTLRCDAVIRYMKADAMLAARKGKS
jgi:hypothetical protein